MKLLALALLVARVVLADDHDVAIAADDAAVLAHGLDAGGDLHFFFSRCLRTNSLIEHVLIERAECTNQPLLSSCRAPGWRYL